MTSGSPAAPLGEDARIRTDANSRWSRIRADGTSSSGPSMDGSIKRHGRPEEPCALKPSWSD